MPRPTLIFDLDRTIVYPHVCDAATNDDIIQYAAWQTVERLRAPSTNTNVHGISKGLPRRGLDAGPLIGNSFRMFENTIYVRPGIIDCLRRLSKSFDLAVATLGGAEYASNVLGVIDPDASIFDNRVASRENFRDGVKRIPHEWGGIAGAIVFDDTPSAWESDALVFPAVAYFGPPCQGLRTPIISLLTIPRIFAGDSRTDQAEPRRGSARGGCRVTDGIHENCHEIFRGAARLLL